MYGETVVEEAPIKPEVCGLIIQDSEGIQFQKTFKIIVLDIFVTFSISATKSLLNFQKFFLQRLTLQKILHKRIRFL